VPFPARDLPIGGFFVLEPLGQPLSLRWVGMAASSEAALGLVEQRFADWDADQAVAFQYWKTCLQILSGLVFAIGSILVAATVAFLYGVSTAPRGAYQDAFIVSIIAGFLYFLVLKISRCRHVAVAVAPLIMASLAFIAGHYVAYYDAHDFAWNYGHDIAPEKFSGPEWQDLDRDANFRRFVGYVTDTPGDGVWAYLMLAAGFMAAAGAGKAGQYMAGCGVAWANDGAICPPGYETNEA